MPITSGKMGNFVMITLLAVFVISFCVDVSTKFGLVTDFADSSPPGAYDIKELGKGWKTFRMDIGDRKGRLFLHRLTPNFNSTESLTEILEPDHKPEGGE